jgi:hypothetical protein
MNDGNQSMEYPKLKIAAEEVRKRADQLIESFGIKCDPMADVPAPMPPAISDVERAVMDHTHNLLVTANMLGRVCEAVNVLNVRVGKPDETPVTSNMATDYRHR